MQITRSIANVSAYSPAVPPAASANARVEPQAGPAPKKLRISDLDLDLAASEIAYMQALQIAALAPIELADAYERAYLLQQDLIRVVNDTPAAADPRKLDRALELLRAATALRTPVIRRLTELSDAKNPPKVEPWQVFRNTMKRPGFHAASLEQRYYLDKAGKFIAQGGDFEQIQPVSRAFLDAVPSGVLCEWVVTADDQARICRSDLPVVPNHTLLAHGGDALSAGSLRVNKTADGSITTVVVGTWSGHFRTDLASLAHMARHLVTAGIPAERILLQEDEAQSDRSYDELLLPLLGQHGAVEQRAAALSAPTLGEELAFAVAAMREATREAFFDSIILSTTNDPQRLVECIERVLILAEQAGNPGVFRGARALLKHFVLLEAPHIDAAAARMFEKLWSRWEGHVFGSGAKEAGDDLCARPVGRRGRIMATLDLTHDLETLNSMIAAGMDIGRINLARGEVPEVRALIARVRRAAAELGKDVRIAIDLPGPKIRLGKFKNPENLTFNDIVLPAGKEVTLTTKEILGDADVIPVEYEFLGQDVKPGHAIFLNDGKVRLQALSSEIDEKGVATVKAKVLVGGKIWDRKGINLPKSKLSVRTITDFDVARLEALLDVIDLVGVSFARSPEDIFFCRAKMAKKGKVVPVIAKIETSDGLTNLEAIAAAADGLMVARGDLGAEIGYENVPDAERRINEVGNVMGKPTIVATEAFESMVKEPSRPTRAEVEALYSAFYGQGAECIMLGRSTSGGKFPAEAVRAAATVIHQAEENARDRSVRAVALAPREVTALDSMLRAPVERYEELLQ